MPVGRKDSWQDASSRVPVGMVEQGGWSSSCTVSGVAKCTGQGPSRGSHLLTNDFRVILQDRSIVRCSLI